MSADNKKIFEKTILDKIDLLSSYRDNIASSLKAKGLNVNVGDSLSTISFAAASQDDEYAIKADDGQFGQVKLISSDDNAQLSTISSQISALSANSPYVIPAKKNYNILSGLDSTKVNKISGNAEYLAVKYGELSAVNIKPANVNDINTYPTFEGIVKNSILQNVDFRRLSSIDIISSSNIYAGQISTDCLINSDITKISEIKHLPIGNKALINGYYGTLANLGYTSEDCSDEDGKFYPVKISICKRNDDTPREQNKVPIYTRILKRNSNNDAWELLYQSYNSIVIRTYNLLCGANNCLMGPLYLSGSEPIDLTSNIAITFTSSLSEPFDQTTFQLPVATTVAGGGYTGVFTGNISSGVPTAQNYCPILAIQGKNVKNYTEDLLHLIQRDVETVSALENTVTTAIANLTAVDANLNNRVTTLEQSLTATGSGIATRVNTLETSVTSLNGTVTNLNTSVAELNSKVDGLTGLTDEVNNITTNIDNIETSVTEITGKVDSINNEVSNKTTIQLAEGLNGTYTSASTFYIKKVSLEEYAEYLYNNPDAIISSNEMFVVSSDYLFGFDNKIINVKDGESATDAATFGQLSALSAQVQELKALVDLLSAQITSLTATP